MLISDLFQYSTSNNQPHAQSPNQPTVNPVIDVNDNQSKHDIESGTQSVSDGTQQQSMINGNGNQEFSAEDVRELMYHIQWLQSQLSQV